MQKNTTFENIDKSSNTKSKRRQSNKKSTNIDVNLTPDVQCESAKKVEKETLCQAIDKSSNIKTKRQQSNKKSTNLDVNLNSDIQLEFTNKVQNTAKLCKIL